MTLALCATSTTPDDWFADPATEPDLVSRAVTTCERCPIQRTCVEEASQHEYGVWGGVVITPPVQLSDVIYDGRGQPGWSPSDETQFVADVDAGMSGPDLAVKHHGHERAVQRYIRTNGLRPSRREADAKRFAEIVRMWNEGASIAGIGEAMGIVTPDAVRMHVRKAISEGLTDRMQGVPRAAYRALNNSGAAVHLTGRPGKRLLPVNQGASIRHHGMLGAFR